MVTKLNKPRTKADVIRHTRKTAQKMTSSSRIYKRIIGWDEMHIGSDNPQFIITLKPEWSFDPDTLITERTFSSVHDAMAGINMTYKSKGLTKPEPVDERSWMDKLDALKNMK